MYFLFPLQLMNSFRLTDSSSVQEVKKFFFKALVLSGAWKQPAVNKMPEAKVTLN